MRKYQISKRKAKKVMLVWILSAALVLGIFPGVSYADGDGGVSSDSESGYVETEMEQENTNILENTDDMENTDVLENTDIAENIDILENTDDGETPDIGENTNITIVPTLVTYDGAEHNVVASVTKIEVDEDAKESAENQEIDVLTDSTYQVQYRMKGSDEWTDAMPKMTNAGSYFFTVKIMRDGYADYISEQYEAVVYTKELEGITVAYYSGENGENPVYDGEEHDAVVSITRANFGGEEEGSTIENENNSNEEETMIVENKREEGEGSSTENNNKEKEKSTIENKNNSDEEDEPTIENKNNSDEEDEPTIENKDNSDEEEESTEENENTSEGEEFGEDKTDNAYKDDQKTTTGKNDIDVLNNDNYQVQYCLNGGGWTDEMPKVKDAGVYTVKVKISVFAEEGALVPDEMIELPTQAITVEKRAEEMAFMNQSYIDQETTAVTLKGKVPYLGQTFSFEAKAGNARITYSLISGTDCASLDDEGKVTVFYPGIITVKAEMDDDNYEGVSISHTLQVTGETEAKGDYLSFSDTELTYELGTESEKVSSDQEGLQVVSDQKVTLLGGADSKITGEITYSLNLADALLENGFAIPGLFLNQNTGTLSVSDYGKLAEEIRNAGGELALAITATKESSEWYGSDRASYVVKLKFAETPSHPYTLSGIKGNNGWYTSEVTVMPAEGYRITKDLSEKFDETAVFANEGETERYIYLKNMETGAITDQIAVTDEGNLVKIDTDCPKEVEINYKKPIASSVIGEMIYQFYNPSVTVVFTAMDEASGVSSFAWNCEEWSDDSGMAMDEAFGVSSFAWNSEERSDGSGMAKDEISGVSSFAWNSEEQSDDGGMQQYTDAGAIQSVLNEESVAGGMQFYLDSIGSYCGVVPASAVQNVAGKYSASVTLPLEEARQLAGSVSVAVTDEAGNVSELKKDKTVFIVDTVTPVLNTNVCLNSTTEDGVNLLDEEKNVRYLSGAAKVFLTITETNFYGEDVKVVVTKDGTAQVMGALEWENIQNTNQYTASVLLEEDGEYVLTVTYTDRAGNQMDAYISENMIVDSTAPLLTATYTNPSCKDETISKDNEVATLYYGKDVTIAFEVTEKNFFEEDVTVQVSKDGGAFADTELSWTNASNGMDVHMGTYTITAKKDHSNDGEYRFRMMYTDRCGNQMTTYSSNEIVLDTMAPTISVNYVNTYPVNVLKDSENHIRSYFDSAQSATVMIEEHYFNVSEVNFTVLAKDANGNILENADQLYQISEWTDVGDCHTVTITYPGDANYTFDVSCADRAANQALDYKEDYFTVDTTAPECLSIRYSDSIRKQTLNAIAFGFYNKPVTVTITAQDTISSVYCFQYAYQTATDVSSINAGVGNQMIDESSIQYSNGRTTATATFTIPYSALGEKNQFNGTVDFTATDRANNVSASFTDGKRIVVDNIAPTATVEYGAPVQNVENISYYAGTITAKVTITEANFDSDDVKIETIKDGITYPADVSWEEQGTDVHVGTFLLSEDGDYFVTVNYRDKSANRMATYTSGQMTVDTQIEAPVITINGEDGNGKAYKGDVVPAIRFSDVNYESYEVTLTRTRFYDIEKDVSDEFIQSGIEVGEEGGSGSFDAFERNADTDGIYTMVVSMKDRAGHTAETMCTFTVNRYGSVYVYGDALVDLIKDGGQYVQEVAEDLVITEYNADQLEEGSLNIQVTKGAHALENVAYRVSPEMNEQAETGDSGWYQYQYTISKENFEEEGVYKISVASKDETGNSPETTNYGNQDILFRVDKHAPEISSISGLEENMINADGIDVKYAVYDTIGLQSVEVYVDGEKIDTIHEFPDENYYEGTFHIAEKPKTQAVRLVVTDLSKRVTDTSTDEFNPAFDFNDTVLISTSLWVRWYTNKVLMVGSMIGVAAAAGGLLFLFAWKHVKKRRRQGM